MKNRKLLYVPHIPFFIFPLTTMRFDDRGTNQLITIFSNLDVLQNKLITINNNNIYTHTEITLKPPA